MAQKNYERSFTSDRTPVEVYRTICNVKGWWTRETEGSAEAVGDEFTIHFGKLWKTMRVITAEPGERIAWRVIDCHMPFVKDVKEWKGTTMRFDLSRTPEGTLVTLTHIGLVPKLECYEACEEGWAHFFGKELPKVLRRSERSRSEANAKAR